MRRSTLSLVVVAIGACITLEPTSLFAQHDSTLYDGGTLKFNRALTQHISIKGEDLEKMPFTDLSEAINVWLYGAYTRNSNLHYVVDGIPLGDVNGYSVFDVEEITLVQDALAQSNGVYQNQQLVLIRTRKSRGTGLTLAAEDGLVRKEYGEGGAGRTLPSETNLFQHYYLGFHHEVKNIRFGISADFTRDVFPAINADSIHTVTPFSLKRWQLGGWLTADLNKHNQLTVQLNYTPQKIDSAQGQTVKGFSTVYSRDQVAHQHEHIINPMLSWRTQFAKGLENELQFGYLSWGGNQNAQARSINPGPPPDTVNTLSSGHGTVEHFLIRDRLSYTLSAGHWLITPSLNFYYEHDHVSFAGQTATTTTVFSGFLNSYYFTLFGHGHLEELTPALNITYKQALNIQGGWVAGLTHNYQNTFAGKPVNRQFPFVSVSTDLLGWRQEIAPASFKLFFSYAGSANISTSDYALSSLVHPGALTNIEPQIVSSISTGGFGAGSFYFASADQLTQHFWQWDAGASFATADGRLQVNYHYERQKFISLVSSPIPYGYGTIFSWTQFRSSLHYLGITATIIQGHGLTWQTGLSVTTLRVTALIYPSTTISESIVGNVNSSKPDWTGGWVNRLHCGLFSLGADLLYHFNGQSIVYTGAFQLKPPAYINSLLMQQFYLGYRLLLAKARVLDFYLDGRGLFRSGRPDVSDGRQYFGAGARLNI